MKKTIALISLCLVNTTHATIDYSVKGEITSNGNNNALLMSGTPSLPTELKDSLKSIKKQIKTKGYYESDNEYAKFLINLENENSTNLLPTFMDENGENDFIKDPNKLKLAVQKKFPSYIMKKEILGTTPIGSWIKNKNGWSGYKLFFKQNKLTTCAFSYFNLSMSNGHVMPSNNDNEKEYIGEKESSSEVSGNEKSGYIYSVMWFTSDEVKVLDCAQSEFTKNEINSVKKLAELIDGNQ